MAASKAARAVPAATRYAHVLDAAAVHDELDRLWAEVGGRGGDGGVEGDRSEAGASAVAAGPGPLVRANTLNLIAVARSGTEGERIGDVVANLAGFFPSRAIILVADPDQPGSPTPGLDVRARLLERAAKGRPTVRFECVTVAADAGATDQLPSIASPLLIAELPDFLWWPGEVADGDRSLTELLKVVDRLIVDTAMQRDPASCLGAIAGLLRAEPCPKLSDFAWARLTPWRQVLAQFFDTPTARRSLDGLDDVTIDYTISNGEIGSGLSAAALLVGWLATRLGWEAAEGAADGGTRWRLESRSGTPRQVTVTARPTRAAADGQGLIGVRLATAGNAPASFAVERMNPDGLLTTSEGATMTRVSRLVHAGLPDEADLLSQELRTFERDRVYEEALVFAAGLLSGEAVPA